MRDLFAVDDPSADAAYTNIRTPTCEGAAVARSNCNDLWRDFEPYATEHFRLEFRHIHLKTRLNFRGVPVHPDERVS